MKNHFTKANQLMSRSPVDVKVPPLMNLVRIRQNNKNMLNNKQAKQKYFVSTNNLIIMDWKHLNKFTSISLKSATVAIITEIGWWKTKKRLLEAKTINYQILKKYTVS